MNIPTTHESTTHLVERHEKGHKNKFKTKVKWYDKKGKGKGR